MNELDIARKFLKDKGFTLIETSELKSGRKSESYSIKDKGLEPIVVLVLEDNKFTSMIYVNGDVTELNELDEEYTAYKTQTLRENKLSKFFKEIEGGKRVKILPIELIDMKQVLRDEKLNKIL